MAVGRIKVAGRTTPWVGNAMLMLDGRSHRLGGFGHVPSTDVIERPTGADFELKGKGAKVTGNVAPRPRTSSPGSTPTRSGRSTTPSIARSPTWCWTSRSTAGPAERLTVRGAATYEFGTRDTDHGIPVQPYPDG